MASVEKKITASITEHVIKLQELTQKNLEILQALNDSFFTNQNHLSVKVGDNKYAMPSFISLENKLNSLTANFENLVNAPETGEAFFDFNGNSRAIEVRSYTTTPNSLTLTPITDFNIEHNDIFKDFLTPTPYIHIGAQSLPNDITQVMMKKIIPLNPDLKQLFKTQLDTQSGSKTSVQYKYADLYKILTVYEQDKDYIEYDTKLDLPIRKNVGTGTYVIEQIVEDIVDDNLDNYITIKLRSDVQDSSIMSCLKYRLFDETIEKTLQIGDELITYEGNAKMQIINIFHNTNTIVVKVLYGDFLNLVPATSNDPQYISSLSKIKFYSPISFNNDKYVKVPLEEDQYIYVAIAALNSRMNIQASWGTGLLLDTYALTCNGQGFKDYYDNNVKNVGDILFEISSMLPNTLTKYSKTEFDKIINFKPVINVDNLDVIQINNHLNNSPTIQNIKLLYSQKKTFQSQLDSIQDEINDLNNILSTISFDDTTGRRIAYTSQVSSLNTRRNEISSSITKIIDEISKASNNSEVPIENAKYHIRGYFDVSDNEWKEHIKGIQVQYRYKNQNQTQNNALTINDRFTFSDWNEMIGFEKEHKPLYKNGEYISVLEDNSDINEVGPLFNQIDIPITQGETVDIRLKVVYDFGAPFVKTTSQWSDLVNIKFPEKYLAEIKILDIITENNNDIETNRFNNIIKNEGIPDHIKDKITDQDITYFHKPENIASGFYTAERRIIPLKDKLADLNNLIIQMQDEIYGTSSEDLKISIKQNSAQYSLAPFVENHIFTESYASISMSDSPHNGNYEYDRIITNSDNTKTGTGLITTVFNLSILNDSDHVVKLYSMFPGSRDVNLSTLINHKFPKGDFYGKIDQENNKTQICDIPYEYPNMPENGSGRPGRQGGNQFIYFRTKDVNTGENFYAIEDKATVNGMLSFDDYKCTSTGALKDTSMWMYLKLTKKFGLCLDSNTVGSHVVIKPKEEFLIPIVVEFYINDQGPTEIYKTMSFDILPSLYKDPMTYQFSIHAKYQNTIQDQLIINDNQSGSNDVKYNIIYR